MKSKITLPFLLLFFNQLVAQEVITTEVQDSFKTPQYEVVYDDVFLSKKETKSLLKVDFLPLLNTFNEFSYRKKGLGLEFEQKMLKQFSINSGLFTDILNFYRNYKPMSFFIEPRWYLNQKVNNLNGNYLSLKTELFGDFTDENFTQHLNFSLNYGIQRRVYNNWYANFNAGLVYAHTYSENYIPINNKKIGYVGDFTIGLAFGDRKKSKFQSCDVFNCFEEEKSLFKVDLRGLLIRLNSSGFITQPIISFEHKISPSWSLNYELRANYISPGKATEFRFGDTKIAAFIEPRYYYNMKKRIAQGKSANNLSGNYFTLAMGYMFEYKSYQNPATNFIINDRFEKRKYIAFLPKYGIQRRIFDKGFIDISFAPFQFFYVKSNVVFEVGEKGNIQKEERNRDFILKVDLDIQPMLDIKIGLAF
jgi:hypothetical protein